MQQKQLTQVFNGINTNKDETLLNRGAVRDMVNFDIDQVQLALSKRFGADFAFEVPNIEKIKGCYFFEFNHYNENTKTETEYRYLAVVANKIITGVHYDVLFIVDLNDTSDFIDFNVSDYWIRNLNIAGYNTLYDTFFSDTETQLNTNSEKYYFLSINNELWIHNRKQPPFRFYIDVEETDDDKRKKGLFSYVTIPDFFSPPDDDDYQLSVNYLDDISWIGSLEFGLYKYKYTYYNSTDDMESQPFFQEYEYKTKQKATNVIKNPTYGHPAWNMNIFYFNNNTLYSNKLKTFIPKPLRFDDTNREIDGLNYHELHFIVLSAKLIHKKFNNKNEWKIYCESLNPVIPYKDNYFGSVFIYKISVSIYLRVLTTINEYTTEYEYITGYTYSENENWNKLQINEYKYPLPQPTWGDIKSCLYVYGAIGKPIIGDIEIKYDSTLPNIQEEILDLTAYSPTMDKKLIYMQPIMGATGTKKTVEGDIEYEGSDFLCDDNEFNNCLFQIRYKIPETSYRAYIENHNFYSVNLYGIGLVNLPVYEDVVEIKHDKLKIAIPYNELITNQSKIDKVKVYRTRCNQNIFYLDSNPTNLESVLPITFDINGKWSSDLEYISYIPDLTITLNSDELQEGLININEIYQFLLHNNRIAIITPDRFMIRYSELTPDYKDFYASSYIAFTLADGGKIVKVIPFMDNWIVLLNKNVFVIYNVSQKLESNILEIQDRTIGDNTNGCISEGSVQVTTAGVIFASQDGFRKTDGFQCAPIDFSEKKYKKYYEQIDWSKENQINSWYYDFKYYCYVILKSGESAVFVYHIAANEWVIYKDFSITTIINNKITDNYVYYAEAEKINNSVYIKKLTNEKKYDFYERGIFTSANPDNATDATKNWTVDILKNLFLNIYDTNTNELLSTYLIKSNTANNITIDGNWSGYILGAPQYPVVTENKYYHIIKPIVSYIETMSIGFGAFDLNKIMKALELYYKSNGGYGILTIYYSIDGGEYIELCRTTLAGSAGFGGAEYSTTGQGGYYSDDFEKTDYYNRIGKIPFFNQHRGKRFDTIKFKFEHSGIEDFQLHKILYYFELKKKRRNNFVL